MLQIVNLKNSLRNVALGRAFVLQGGKWIQLNRTSPAAVAKILQYNTERPNRGLRRTLRLLQPGNDRGKNEVDPADEFNLNLGYNAVLCSNSVMVTDRVSGANKPVVRIARIAGQFAK